MTEESPLREVSQLDDRELLDRIRQHDEAAERALFQRYYDRLLRFARGKMNLRLQTVEPASDVALSAMKSVLLGIPLGRVEVGSRGDLWPLLVAVTLNKIRSRWRRHSGPRRDLGRNVPLGDYEFLLCREGDADAAELNDLVEQLLSKFPGRRRRILEMVLEGYRVNEIARELGIAERTVYNTRQRAMATLRELLECSQASDEP
jgi:RNA polymerase sigma factor (sigma-70 family)